MTKRSILIRWPVFHCTSCLSNCWDWPGIFLPSWSASRNREGTACTGHFTFLPSFKCFSHQTIFSSSTVLVYPYFFVFHSGGQLLQLVELRLGPPLCRRFHRRCLCLKSFYSPRWSWWRVQWLVRPLDWSFWNWPSCGCNYFYCSYDVTNLYHVSLFEQIFIRFDVANEVGISWGEQGVKYFERE